MAAADMSSTEPAWMPPIKGSTNRSATRRPNLRDTRGPMERSPIGPRTSGRGSSASPAGRATPRRPRMPDRAVGQKRIGMPRASPSGSGRIFPRAQTAGPRPPMGTSASPRPISRHSSHRFGPPPEKTVGTGVDGVVPNGTLWSAPPSRDDDSRTTTWEASASGPARRHHR